MSANAVSHDLHITIATAGSPLVHDIGREVELIKSALLYADRVAIASHKLSRLAAGARLSLALERGDEKELASALRGLPSDLHRNLAENRQSGQSDYERTAQHSGVADLKLPLEGRVLTIESVGLGPSDRPYGQKIVLDYSDVVMRLFASRSTSFPLLDNLLADLARAIRDLGLLPESPLPERRARETQLLTRYLGALPTFPEASMEAVMEASDDFRPAVIRFRGELAKLAEAVQDDPSTDAFEAVADDLYRRDVAPALEDLRALAQEYRIRRLLGHVASKGGGAVTKSALTLAITHFGQLPEAVQAITAALAASVDVAGSVLERRRELSVARSANRFVWLHNVEERFRPPLVGREWRCASAKTVPSGRRDRTGRFYPAVGREPGLRA